jgi:hypothetical protein
VGRPIGSLNKQKPFRDALQMAVRRRPLILHQIADQVLDQAKAGDLAAAREVADRLDGKPGQAIEHGDVPLTQLTDAQLYAIAAGGLTETDLVALPPPDNKARNS